MTKRFLMSAVALASFGLLAATAASAAENSLELHFAGAERVSQNGRGGLDVITRDGTIHHYRPQVWQMVDGKRHEVLPMFHVVSRDRVELEFRNVDPSARIEVRNIPQP